MYDPGCLEEHHSGSLRRSQLRSRDNLFPTKQFRSLPLYPPRQLRRSIPVRRTLFRHVSTNLFPKLSSQNVGRRVV